MSYPLGQYERDSIRSKTGKSPDEITLETVTRGEVSPEDIKISADVLQRQARVAEDAGRPWLARSFVRAGELVDVPDELILKVYNLLRPNRAGKDELLATADMLERDYNAVSCARLVREAAEVYAKRGVLK